MVKIKEARRRSAPPPKSLVALAKRINLRNSDPTKMAMTGSGWQDAAWHFYNTVGEYSYAVNWVGNLMSRARLFATYDDGTGPKRVPKDSVAERYVDALFGSEQGRSAALQLIGVHYTVAGECYIVGTENSETGVEEWTVVAPSRMRGMKGSWVCDGQQLAADDMVIRIWRPHPVETKHATSPSRAALPILSEIERLTMHVAAQVDSRLASAGILFLPDRMTLAVKTENGDTITGNADTFVDTLQDVMGRAIANREDPSALVPIVVTADGEVIDSVRLLQFWSELDSHAIELRTEAIRRLALSMDMPPEILTGSGEATQWNAWNIDESAIKSHSEPLLSRVANDFANGYLQPLLLQDGLDPEEARRYGVGVDTTEMRLRPNRAEEATGLWDRGILNDAAVVRETGFKPEDIQDDAEHQRWFLNKVASGQTQPEVVEAALRALGIELEVRPELDAPDSERPDQHEARPVPNTDGMRTPGLPENSEMEASMQARAAMLTGCEVLVFRALERAGNRMRSITKGKMGKIPGVAASETYMFHKIDPEMLDHALEDAWTAVERFAPEWGVDSQRLADCLDAYTRAILAEQKLHDRKMMSTFLELARAEA